MTARLQEQIKNIYKSFLWSIKNFNSLEDSDTLTEFDSFF